MGLLTHRSARDAKLSAVPGGKEPGDGLLSVSLGWKRDASNQREDRRVNYFRRHPRAAFDEIERRGSRMQLALASLPSWLTGFDAHPGGRRLQRDLTGYLVEQGLLGGIDS